MKLHKWTYSVLLTSPNIAPKFPESNVDITEEYQTIISDSQMKNNTAVKMLLP